jgi:hypothetical protein
MRKHCVLSIFIVLQLFCTAQKDTLHKRGVGPGTININLGIGYSTIFYAANGIAPYQAAQPIFILPAVTAFTDYNCTRRSSVGAAITYQYIFQYPVDNNDEVIYHETQFMQRINVSFRYLLHFSRKPENDFYIGIRPGLSIWIDNTTSSDNATGAYNPAAVGTTRVINPSIQFLIGYKGYVSKHVGVHFELGIGTSCLLEGDLSYRFNGVQW